ncbi:2-oxoglutarate receptor 1-like [Cyprinodon tularosa]|uniref:2-oxoglutarate receptor 1-like n=1 Tax=Cyprinodon tularosa TaxID=77115 RepID=UPI0018E1F507|nr:2-oxoglutarate receptor 1-like [Cyprinodon tularosa]XP_038151857.1 2-oxoglutarate receptor 1-like [Cyprinodon tularosa]
MAGLNNSCTFLDDFLKRYYLSASYGIIFIVGVIGNLTSITIYLTKLRPWKSSSIIMVNLALTDLLYVLTLPFLVYYYSNGESWMLGDFMCRFVRFAFHFHLYGSILSLTCVAVFRFLVVTKPLRVAQLQQKHWGAVACLVVWIVAAAEVTPMLTIISLTHDDNMTFCVDFANTETDGSIRTYNLLLTAFGFALPLVLVFIFYIGIVKRLARGSSPTSSYRMRARRVTILILLVFVMCYLPYHILRVLWVEIRMSSTTQCTKYIVHAAYIISRPLAGLNTFFNLALYTLSGDNFRKAFLDIFCREQWISKARSLLHLNINNRAENGTPAA